MHFDFDCQVVCLCVCVERGGRGRIYGYSSNINNENNIADNIYFIGATCFIHSQLGEREKLS